jgi:long-chain-fatty-acid--[acyl-carrier-protein] ligase
LPVLRKGLKAILLNGIFFTPRRKIDIELVEPDDLPRRADRKAINRYLEGFFNKTVERNTYVPYTIWERGGVQVRPEPQDDSMKDAALQVPPVVRKQVIRKLQDMTGISDIKEEMSLVKDIGMDSLAIVEIISWLESEYGYSDIEVDSLRNVEDVFLAASGAAISKGEKTSHKIPAKWFQSPPAPFRPENLADMKITSAFLFQASRQPGKVAIADQVSGVLRYRDIILAIMILKKRFEKLEGQYVGIMLPASATVSIVYYAVLFAGKIPVMVNWTQGIRNLKHSMDLLSVRHIITARALLSRIEAQGIQLNELKEKFILLEELRSEIGRLEKFYSFVKSWLRWSDLEKVSIPDTAAVLFTSGSETIPKAVPLTHRNILTNVSDAYECFTLSSSDSFLGILPPFHSFGLTVSLILPLSLGSRVVFYPNPTHSGALGEIINAYKITLLLGTPTFLNGILRASKSEQLQSLRLVVSGAEKCPQRVYELLAETCPGTKVLEGYGVTECSPIISVNHESNPQNGTIGKVMSSLEYVIVDPESSERLPTGHEGMLLVRGDSVFSNYLNYDGPSPFVECEGKKWYRTGDLVSEDAQGVLTFCGRLKRFIKLGGEMISLPAIESVLEKNFTETENDGPILAVVATPDEDKAYIVLFCTQKITRESANTIIRKSGLSGLHNIRQVKHVDSLPLLGTGKVDYKTLIDELASELNNMS